jgi:carbohydrate binding protein with CBM4/9 domain
LLLLVFVATYAAAANAQNLLSNGSFDANLAGWQAHGSSVSTAWDHDDISGSASSGSAKVTAQAALTGSQGGGIQQSFSVTPGTTYRLTGSAQLAGGGSARFILTFPTAIFTNSISQSSWTSIAPMDYRAPSGATNASVSLDLGNAPAGASAFFDAISVIALPTAITSFTASPASLSPGQCTTLSFVTTSVQTASIDHGIGPIDVDPSLGYGSAQACPKATTTYTLTATGPGGTVTKQVTVTVIQPGPSATFTASPTSIATGQSSTLSWTTSNATSVSIDNGLGAQPVNGSTSVSPSATTTYTLTASGSGGTVTRQATVTVLPLPMITFNASPSSITTGQSSTLTWSTANATSVTIDHGMGTQPTSGSLAVTPSVTTTYTLTATGAGGTAITARTITVTAPNAPQVLFSATPATLGDGDAATLSWAISNATAASIDNGIGAIPLSGSTLVRPHSTTTYTLTASGSGGTRSAFATVTVAPPPTIVFSVEPAIVAPGGAATLHWDVFDAASVVLDHDLGAQPFSGTLVMRPTTTTTFLLTANGVGGTRTGQVTISVVMAKRRAVRH